MKILFTINYLTISMLLIYSCSKTPQKTVFKDSINKEVVSLLQNDLDVQKGLWLVISDYQVSSLIRIDLESGKIERNKLPTVADSVIYPDGEEGLFLLNRMNSDSIHILKGKDAQVISSIPLTDRVNPQHAIRDKDNRVWVISQDSNNVSVYSSNAQLIKKIDLSGLKDSFDSYAELSYLIELPNGDILVTASRMKRNFSGYNWVPEKQSGVAIIDHEILETKKEQLIDIANITKGFVDDRNDVILIGNGDVSSIRSQNSGIGFFDYNGEGLKSLNTNMFHEYTILDSYYSKKDNTHSYIAWYRDQKKSCIHHENKILYCESDNSVGYIFEKIVSVDNIIFVSFVKNWNPKLLMIRKDHQQVWELDLVMPIVSISRGP